MWPFTKWPSDFFRIPNEIRATHLLTYIVLLHDGKHSSYELVHWWLVNSSKKDSIRYEPLWPSWISNIHVMANRFARTCLCDDSRMVTEIHRSLCAIVQQIEKQNINKCWCEQLNYCSMNIKVVDVCLCIPHSTTICSRRQTNEMAQWFWQTSCDCLIGKMLIRRCCRWIVSTFSVEVVSKLSCWASIVVWLTYRPTRAMCEFVH